MVDLLTCQSGDVRVISVGFVHNLKILCFNCINPKYVLNNIFRELQAPSVYHGEQLN